MNALKAILEEYILFSPTDNFSLSSIESYMKLAIGNVDCDIKCYITDNNFIGMTLTFRDPVDEVIFKLKYGEI